jgi:hypothetical protein
MLPAVAAPTLATAKTAKAASSTRRRPSASDSAPCHSVMAANASR